MIYERHDQARNAAFVQRCRQLLSSGAVSAQADAMTLVRAALNTAPPQYYVSFERALFILTRLRAQGLPRRLSTSKMQLWADLNERVEEVMASRPRLSFRQALNFTLNFKQPRRFYISESVARRLLRGHLHTGGISFSAAPGRGLAS